jgi:ABC-2 type transport system ATP-binding protein
MWTFLKKINREGTTIILTTHYLEEAEALCRHIAIINHGKIVENTSIKTLLRQLRRETFVLDCVEELPDTLSIAQFQTRRVDSHTLEVDVEKGQHINQVFAALDNEGIHISSMRNRANRLEEMFVNLVEGAA